MKKSCGVLLFLFLLVGGAYFYLLPHEVTMVARLILSLFGAISILLIFSSVRGLWLSSKKVKAMRRAQEGGIWGEGELAAAVGKVRAERAPLLSPIFENECVIYDYAVFREIPQQKGAKPMRDHIYTGMGVSPFLIQGAGGNTRVLGFPDLQYFPEKSSLAESDMAQFNTFAEKNNFEVTKGLDKLKLFGQLENMVNDTDGMVFKNWRMAEVPESSVGIKLAEKAVAVGQQVVAFGKYSAEKMAIVTEPGAFGAMIELFAGTPEKVRKELRGNSIFLLIFAAVWSLFVNTIVAVLVFRK